MRSNSNTNDNTNDNTNTNAMMKQPQPPPLDENSTHNSDVHCFPLPSQQRVLLFTLLFGDAHLQQHLRVWARTASTSGVHIMIISDHDLAFPLPPHITVLRMTFKELVSRVSNMVFEGKSNKQHQAILIHWIYT